MNIELDRKSPTDASIKITINEADYQPQVDKKIKTYSKQMTLKGFRPGKVPPAIVKRMYGKSLIIEEINELLQTSLSDYINENNLRIVGDPVPNYENQEEINWDVQKDFDFKFDLGIVPDFEYKPEELAVVLYEISPDKEKMHELLNSFREQYGESQEVESIEEKDFVYGHLKELNAVSEEPSASEEDTEASSEEVEAPQPFEKEVFLKSNQIAETEKERFMSIKVGEKATFSIQNLFAEGVQTLSMVTGLDEQKAAELQGEFELTVNKITRTTPAEMNADFFKKVLGPEAPDNEADFLQKLEDILQENTQQEADQFLKEQIFKESIEKTSMELPEEFLRKRILDLHEGVMSTEELDQNYEQFARSLKWSMIRNDIMKKADIQIEEGEVEAQARNMFMSQFGGNLPQDPAIMQQIDAIVQQQLQAEDGRQYRQIAEQIIEEKVLTHLQGLVKPETKSVNRQEFDEVLTEATNQDPNN